MSLRLKKEKWEPTPFAPKLTEKETIDAFGDLVVTSYPCVERGIQDPSIVNQSIALFSFCPAEKNDFGILGFGKIRGVFATDEEACNHSRMLIRKHDSANPIHHVRVGRPFPVCGGITKLHKELDKVIIDEELEKAENAMIKVHKNKEQDVKNELDKRKEMLESDVNPKDDDPIEKYILLRHKIVNVAILYEEYQEKMEKMKQIMIKTKKELDSVNDPAVLDNYERVYNERLSEFGGDQDDSDEAKKIHSYFKSLPPFEFLQ